MKKHYQLIVLCILLTILTCYNMSVMAESKPFNVSGTWKSSEETITLQQAEGSNTITGTMELKGYSKVDIQNAAVKNSTLDFIAIFKTSNGGSKKVIVTMNIPGTNKDTIYGNEVIKTFDSSGKETFYENNDNCSWTRSLGKDSAETAVVKGCIFDDSTKRPIENSNIYVTMSPASNPGDKRNVAVNSAGYYKIPNIPNGEVNIFVSGDTNNPQYGNVSEKITVKGSTVVRDYYLKPSKAGQEVPDVSSNELDKAKDTAGKATPTPGAVAQNTPGNSNTGDIAEYNMVLIKGGPTGDFYIGKYEVTNKEYSQYDSGHQGSWSNSDYPVETVSWNDAVAYCQWLSNKTGKNYRLPTEAEWEYACRAGSTTDYYWGENYNAQYDTPQYSYSGCSSIGNYAWYYGNSGGTAHPVGQKQPNAWGLYDMAGNVWEWCDSSHSGRVFSGGGWSFYGGGIFCRSGGRCTNVPDDRNDTLGFRVIRTP